MGKKNKLKQVLAYEEQMKNRIETNLKAVEGNIVRLSNDLVDRKAYDQLKELERVRKRFSLLNTKQRAVWPQRMMRDDQKKKWSLDSVVQGMVLLDEMIYRESVFFNEIIPPLEKVILHEVKEPLVVLLNHVSLLLSRMDRLITVKDSIKSSTGDRLLETIRAEVPDLVPRRLRRKAKRYLKKGNFEKLEVYLEASHKGKRVKKHFLKDLLKESQAMEKEMLGTVLSEVGVQFGHADDFKGAEPMVEEEEEQKPKDLKTQVSSAVQALVSRDKMLQQASQLEEQVTSAAGSAGDQISKQLTTLRSDIAQKTANAGFNLNNIVGQVADSGLDRIGKAMARVQKNASSLTGKGLSGAVDALIGADDPKAVAEQVEDVGEEELDVAMLNEIDPEMGTLAAQWKLMKAKKIKKRTFIKTALKTIGGKILGFFSKSK